MQDAVKRTPAVRFVGSPVWRPEEDLILGESFYDEYQP